MSDHVIVRRAETADIPSISTLFDLYRQFYKRDSDIEGARNFVAERLGNKESIVLVAESGQGELLGFAQLYPSFTSLGMARTLILNDLYVLESARGCGIGRLLINAANELGAATGILSINLETRIDNVVARSLYESLGYEADSQFLSYSKRIAGL